MSRICITRRAVLGAVPATTLLAAAGPPPPEAWTLRIDSFDGTSIAYRSIGIGHPILLLHGFLSSGMQNWINPGTAEALARVRRRLIIPDFRGHGLSAHPEDQAAYPPDVLAMDMEAVLAALEVTECDVAGYSLGARVAVRLVARGMRPRKLALCGMGLEGVVDHSRRRQHFEDLILNGEQSHNPQAAAFVAGMMRQNNMTATAALNVLRSQVDTDPTTMAGIEAETLVVNGDQDLDNGDPAALAAAFPNGRVERVPGTHLSTVSTPVFADVLVRFFSVSEET
jgi:pimeloyl-ACP methyl ester carboxylesterase